MRYRRFLDRCFLIFIAAMLGMGASGCSPAEVPESTSAVQGTCGNGSCESGESSSSCPQDCIGLFSSMQVETVLINSEGSAEIAVMVAAPRSGRYPEGAGVVVIVPPVFSAGSGFITEPDLTVLGLIQVSYLWPGQSDAITGLQSSGDFDYGGEQSSQVLRDVIRFASGLLVDTNGRYLSTILKITPLTDEVGVYAFSDAGIPAVNTFSLFGDLLPGVRYFIGRENPTVDTLACLEAGFIDDTGQAVNNPFYNYPASYNSSDITLAYTNARWDPAYKNSHTIASGGAYLDLDGSGDISADDYILSGKVPILYGKRYYSSALTQALLDNGSLTLSAWPADLATPQEAASDWPSRQSPGRYLEIGSKMPDLKVMLVFAQVDYAQAAQDKPHIHQAFQGLRFEARLWVRLNSDRAYAMALIPTAGDEFPDNPANTQPADWMQVGAYAYPGQEDAGSLVPLAAVAEMADRSHFGRWDENLGQALYIYFPPTTQP